MSIPVGIGCNKEALDTSHFRDRAYNGSLYVFDAENLVQQGFFQVSQHGAQSLDAAGGSIPDVRVLDEVNDLAILVDIQFLDQIIFDNLSSTHNTFICGFGCGAAVENEHILRIQLNNQYDCQSGN